jgi:hypothetical protein
MAFRKILILFIPLILFSCAQVGIISGGDKDSYAPKPIVDQTVPPNESTFFQGNSVEITFDEFIQLNNPSQTMVMVPNHAKLKASVHRKTLKVEWEEQLQENTTYVIYLNGTVKDVTENNDSLMYYAFTTGSAIDSLTYKVMVTDAWSNQLKGDVTIGLYQLTDSLKPYYFAKSNQFGVAHFTYLKPGEYKLKAFVDDNHDLELQASEAYAFRENLIHLDSSIEDTIPLRISVPKKKIEINTFKYVAPGSFIVGANYPLNDAEFILNDMKIDTNSIRFFSKDSLQLFTNVKELTETQLIVKTKNYSDTASLRLTEKEKTVSLQLSPTFKNKVLGPHESLSFTINDKINSIDTSKILLVNPSDSSMITYSSSYSLNKLTLGIDRTKYKEIDLKLLKGAIQTAAQQSDSVNYRVQLKIDKDYGIIHVDATSFQDQIIVELLQNNALVNRVVLKEDKTHDFSFLMPGEYQFRVIEDLNQNGIWDPSDMYYNIQAEKVLWFSSPTKVRANWEIDVILSPTE